MERENDGELELMVTITRRIWLCRNTIVYEGDRIDLIIADGVSARMAVEFGRDLEI